MIESLKNKGRKGKLLVGYILATKYVDIVVNRFYLMREILFRYF
jgi:hypothetical protein